jgi:hypothetical protein
MLLVLEPQVRACRPQVTKEPANVHTARDGYKAIFSMASIYIFSSDQNTLYCLSIRFMLIIFKKDGQNVIFNFLDVNI